MIENIKKYKLLGNRLWNDLINKKEYNMSFFIYKHNHLFLNQLII